MPYDIDSPLVRLALRQKPDLKKLLADIKHQLTTAAAQNVFERMKHNHEARYCLWNMHTLKCRKPSTDELPDGVNPASIFPWPEAADHEVRLTEEIIQEYTDLLMVSARRAQTSIAPKNLDIAEDARLTTASAWGQTREHYLEEAERERDDMLNQLASYAWAYGHAVGMCWWEETHQTVPRTISADQMLQVFTAAALVAAAQAYNGELPPEEEEALMDEAAYRFEEMLLDQGGREVLAVKLMEYDPDLTLTEARRVAYAMKRGGEVEYLVPTVVSSRPMTSALKPGLNCFYPWDTKRINLADWVVFSDWHNETSLLEQTEAPNKSDRWNASVVKRIIDAGPTGSRIVHELGEVPPWVLSDSVIGQSLEEEIIQNGEKRGFQILTVYYRSTAIGGVPAVYRTIFCPSVMDKPLHHTVLPHLQGRYPLFDYVREPDKATLWESRGVGEMAFSDQEAMRVLVNGYTDNAHLRVGPPLEVPERQTKGRQIIKPRAQFPTRRPGETGIKKIDVAGDDTSALKVEESALARSNRLWQRGPNVDPVVRNNRWEKVTGDWLLAVKAMERLTFSLIQRYVDARLRVGALDGQLMQLDITAEELQGGFSMQVQFDSAVLDPETVEGRMKMLQQYVSTMDKEGLLRTEPVLRLMTMMINPSWGKLLIAPSGDKQREDMDDILRVLAAAMNGVELPYVAGKNHQMRAQLVEQILGLPALDEEGRPITDESGQPLPGRMARIMRENPDVAALVNKRLKFEQFQAGQFKNAETGRTGVEPAQPTAQLYAGA